MEEDIIKLMNVLKCEVNEQTELDLVESDGDEIKKDDTEYESCLIQVQRDVTEYENKNEALLENLNSTSHINEDERKLINDCKDLSIQKLMILNRKMNNSLKDLANHFKQLLMTCQKDIFSEMKSFQDSDKGTLKLYTWRLGVPYFKDLKNFGVPSNFYTNRKTNNVSLLCKYMPKHRRWSAEDQTILSRSVPFRYYQTILKRKEQDLRTLKIKLKKAGGKNKILESELEKNNQELNNLLLKTDYDPPPFHCEEGIDWETIANDDLSRRYTANECCSMWNIYLHPSINKSEWSLEEDEKLMKIAKKYNFQNWDKVAETLGTNRSGFTTFLHYQSALNAKFKKSRFTREEDLLILQAVKKYRIGNYIPWNKVSDIFKDRSQSQVYHRYKYFLQSKQYRKGSFTEGEDVLLKLLRLKYNKSYSQCNKIMSHRSAIQLRNRYGSYLEKQLISRQFTEEEDVALWNHVALHGTENWRLIANTLNRPRSNVRHRYSVLNKFKTENPDKDLKLCAKRFHLNHRKGDSYDIINKVYEKVEKLQHLPSLEEIEEYVQKEKENMNLPLKKRSDHINNFEKVEKELKDFFKSCHKIKPSNQTVSTSFIQSAADGIKTVLNSLGVNIQNLTKEELSDHEQLTVLDVQLLSLIIENEGKNVEPTPSTSRGFPNKIKVLSPNLHTLIGLRSLLIKNQLLKEEINTNFLNSNIDNLLEQRPNVTRQLHSNIDKDLETYAPETRREILRERNMFERRFNSIFRWPAIMSLMEPKQMLLSNVVEPPHPCKEVVNNCGFKKRGRPRKAPNPKIAAMNEARALMNETKQNYTTGYKFHRRSLIEGIEGERVGKVKKMRINETELLNMEEDLDCLEGSNGTDNNNKEDGAVTVKEENNLDIQEDSIVEDIELLNLILKTENNDSD